MQRIRSWVGVALVSAVIAGCFPIPVPPPESNNWNALLPERLPPGRSLPIAFIEGRYSYPYQAVRQSFTISYDHGTLLGSGILKRGAGSAEVSLPLTGVHKLLIRNDEGSIVYEQFVNVADSSRRRLSGVLSGSDLIWTPGQPIELTANTAVPAGATLRIEAGTVVFVSWLANLDVHGSLRINGSWREAVTFLPLEQDRPWGGINLAGGNAEIWYALFTGGGGDEARLFGHSGSQPVIGGTDAQLEATNIAVVNNPGKAFGFERSTIEVEGSLIQRCDTGGEFAACNVFFNNCRFLDMPNDDSTQVDDDNDALYLNGSMGSDTSIIQKCDFVTGKDDAIDHNGAMVIISDCVIEDFDNEGIAASNTNYIRVENCLIQECEQGIEAGYGEPLVEVNHCTIRRCDTGLRFGDWYNWGCRGRLTVQNTISVENRLHNVWNYDVATGGPVPNAIVITYSMVNQAEWDTAQGCIGGVPVMSDEGIIWNTSSGGGAGSDGRNIGRLSGWKWYR